MHPYRTPAPRELEPSPATSCDASAVVSFAAALVVVVLGIVGVGLVWGAEVAGLFATLVAPPFVALATDEVGP